MKSDQEEYSSSTSEDSRLRSVIAFEGWLLRMLMQVQLKTRKDPWEEQEDLSER
jgi:hypothetical protein